VKQIRQRLTYANVMSSIAVFFVLGGATAFAATKIGANELKANSVLTGKIKKEAVTGSKVKNAAITTGKLANGAVTTDKIADRAVTGAKINATTIGKVPHAANADTVGGLTPAQLSVAGSAYKAAVCDPSSATFIPCVSVTLNLPHAGTVVLVGAGGQNSFGGPASGTCEFSIDGVLSSNPSVEPGETGTDSTSLNAQNGFALTSVTGPLAAGNHTFAMVCNQATGDQELHDTNLSAQLVG